MNAGSGGRWQVPMLPPLRQSSVLLYADVVAFVYLFEVVILQVFELDCDAGADHIYSSLIELALDGCDQLISQTDGVLLDD